MASCPGAVGAAGQSPWRMCNLSWCSRQQHWPQGFIRGIESEQYLLTTGRIDPRNRKQPGLFRIGPNQLLAPAQRDLFLPQLCELGECLVERMLTVEIADGSGSIGADQVIVIVNGGL